MDWKTPSALGRPLDVSYPTNRAIAGIAAAVLAGGFLYRFFSLDPAWDSALWGAQAAGAVFFAWALARELDPDRPLAAFAGAALTGLALFAWPLPNLLGLFWLLLVLRAVNRSVGPDPSPLDVLVLLGLTGWLAFGEQGAFGLLTALAAAADARLGGRAAARPLRLRLWLQASFLLAAAAFGVRGLFSPAASEYALLAPALLTGLAFLVGRALSPPPHSVADVTGERLDGRRVRAAGGVAVTVGVLFALFQGDAGVWVWSPLWAALLGLAAWALAARVRAQLRVPVQVALDHQVVDPDEGDRKRRAQHAGEGRVSAEVEGEHPGGHAEDGVD